jgi:cytochrome c oxidase subunit II
MRFGEEVQAWGRRLKAPVTTLAMLLSPQLAWAQQAAASAAPAADRLAVAPGGYVPMKPTPGVGMPVDGGIGLQTQFSPLGHVAQRFHDGPLMWIAVVISVFVLLLLLWVVVRYNSRSNPVPSKNSHNTLLEVAWTVIPALILFVMAFPSLNLLAAQFKSPPAKTLTIKATGNQWFWTYSYPDNGGFEVVSNMLSEEKAIANGEPSHLAADFRMVVPVGEPIRMQITGSDVIHAFAVPSLWFKLDGVPGRINEKVMFVEKPGVYYGQCSELCGARHGYMPITVEALPRPQYNAWVMTQSGGKVDGAPEPAPAASASAAPAAPAAAPSAAAPAATPAASPTPAPKA